MSMGIQERKERHKEDLKRKILDAAIRLFSKHGYQATSIRKIAAEIEFSPTTIYLYYKDKLDIMYALHQEGFRRLGERFYALAAVDHPFERLKAMGRTYVQFALEHKDFYELMFIMKDPLEHLESTCGGGDEETWEEGERTFGALLTTIEACQSHGYFKGQNPSVFALLVWSTVHGLCTLSIHGHMDHVAAVHGLTTESDPLIDTAYQEFTRLLESMK